MFKIIFTMIFFAMASMSLPTLLYADAVTYDFGYQGRLSDSTGKPIAGPIALNVSFFRSPTDNSTLLSITSGLEAVPLQDGIFQIKLTIAAVDYATVFSGPDQPVYIQITDLTHAPDHPYARQKIATVPYAARIPVDGKTIGFDLDGKASLTTSGAAATGKLLSSDGSGGLTWVDPPSSSNVTQVGGVTASAIASAATAANAASSSNGALTIVKRNSSGGFSSDNISLFTTNSAVKVLTVRGAASQTANLQEWQIVSGNAIAAIDKNGALGLGTGTPSGQIEIDIATAATKGFVMKSPAAQTANLMEWQDNLGTTIAVMTPSGGMGLGTGSPGSAFTVVNPNPAQPVAIFKGAASQTANLMEWQNSSGVAVGRFTSGGNFYLDGQASTFYIKTSAFGYGQLGGGGMTVYDTNAGSTTGYLAHSVATSLSMTAMGYGSAGKYYSNDFDVRIAAGGGGSHDLFIANENNGGIKFYTGGDAASNFRMIVDVSGNLGVGTLTPQTNLDVNGVMRLAKNGSPPFACTAAKDGAIALTSVYTMCVCKGGATSWVLTADGSTPCAW